MITVTIINTMFDDDDDDDDRIIIITNKPMTIMLNMFDNTRIWSDITIKSLVR